MDAFSQLPEQAEAKRLLRAALADGPAHAYLFHGPAGVGKRAAGYAFAAELLGDPRPSHPDIYPLEPVGDQIRIDEIRALHRDLHMRPFEADRRVYLVLGADTLNRDAADALLKDLEEPPEYAVIVLIADELGPLPETIRSRCQLVPFSRLSQRAVRAHMAGLAQRPEEELTALARVAAGRLDRAERLLEPKAQVRRAALLEVARSVYLDVEFEPGDAAKRLLEGISERGAEAKEREEETADTRDLPPREAEQRTRRIVRGAERDELLASLEELTAWYRDLIVVGSGAEGAAVHSDHLAELREDAVRERVQGAEAACERVRETWRTMQELNVGSPLALEALFVQLHRELVA